MSLEMFDLIVMEGFKCIIGIYAIWTFARIVKVLNKISDQLDKK